MGLARDATAASPSSASPQQATCMQIRVTACLLGNPTCVTHLATPNPTRCALRSFLWLQQRCSLGLESTRLLAFRPVEPTQPETAATALSVAPTPQASVSAVPSLLCSLHLPSLRKCLRWLSARQSEMSVVAFLCSVRNSYMQKVVKNRTTEHSPPALRNEA